MDYFGRITGSRSRVTASVGCTNHRQRHFHRRQSPTHRPQSTAAAPATVTCHPRPARPSLELYRFGFSRRACGSVHRARGEPAVDQHIARRRRSMDRIVAGVSNGAVARRFTITRPSRRARDSSASSAKASASRPAGHVFRISAAVTPSPAAMRMSSGAPGRKVNPRASVSS